jgi:hypothetical protein
MLRADLAWLHGLRNRLDALNNSWNQWVLGYNPARQKELLRGLGLARTRLANTHRPHGRRQPHRDGRAHPLGAAPAQFGRRHRPQLGPALPAPRQHRFAPRRLGRAARLRHRLARQRPDLAETLTALATDYARLRYGPPTPTRFKADAFTTPSRISVPDENRLTPPALTLSLLAALLAGSPPATRPNATPTDRRPSSSSRKCSKSTASTRTP